MKNLTNEQLLALQDYAALRISLERLCEIMANEIEIHFGPYERRLFFHYSTQEPKVRVSLGHIRRAMDKHARGEVTTEQLSEWAAMLLGNPTYDWEGPDEEQIADWLNEISLLTLKPGPEAE